MTIAQDAENFVEENQEIAQIEQRIYEKLESETWALKTQISELQSQVNLLNTQINS